MRRIVVLAVGLLVLQAPVAQADPDVTVRCGAGIRARLVLDRPADRVRLRFILHGSDPWNRWTIWISRAPGPMGGGHMVFHTSRTADGDGRFVVQRTFLRRRPLPLFGVMARDWQTDQECGAGVWGPEEQAVPALAAPDVQEPAPCWYGIQPGEARAHLELMDMGDRIKVRFEVHGSPAGHSWRIVFRHGEAGIGGFDHGGGQVKFVGIRVAGENGDLAAQRSVRDQEGGLEGADAFAAKARDQQTGQFCHVHTRI